MPDEYMAGQETPVVADEAQNLDLAQDNNAGTTEAQTDGAEGGKESPAKTFTQAEVDAIVQREKAREARRALREVQRQQPQSQPQSQAGQEQQQGKPDISDSDVEAYLARKRSAEAMSAFTEKVEDAVEKYPDYIRVVTDPRVPFSDEMLEFFADSEVGVDLAYELAKQPGKVSEIRRMSPLKAGRELVRMESELKAKPQAKPSKAPDPITPVGKRATSTASSHPSDDDDIDTWMRKERALKRRG